MNDERRVLIVGMGVAGLAVARFLERDGWTPTLIARSPSHRTGGQTVVLRGASLKAVQALGLTDVLEAARVRVHGTSIVDAAGNEIIRHAGWMPGLDADDQGALEILRDDLLELLRRGPGTGPRREELFGESVTAVDERDAGIVATLAAGPQRAFDVVVGADGLYSQVRTSMFGAATGYVKHRGRYLSEFTCENVIGLDRWRLRCSGAESGFIALPIRSSTQLRVAFWFCCHEPHQTFAQLEQQRLLTASCTKELGGVAPTLLDEMTRAPDFACSPIAEVRMDHYFKGRTVLLGDASYSASPLGGSGPILALVGAYVLAEELRRAGTNHALAFPAYEQRMRMFVARMDALDQLNPADPGYVVAIEQANSAITV